MGDHGLDDALHKYQEPAQTYKRENKTILLQFEAHVELSVKEIFKSPTMDEETLRLGKCEIVVPHSRFTNGRVNTLLCGQLPGWMAILPQTNKVLHQNNKVYFCRALVLHKYLLIFLLLLHNPSQLSLLLDTLLLDHISHHLLVCLLLVLVSHLAVRHFSRVRLSTRVRLVRLF